MKDLYRSWIFVATILTGVSGLTFQVAWQKYLSYIVGSESRSVSLVVAIFLLGLATGYWIFGQLTEKKWTKQALLKKYGLVEIAIGTYAILFPIYFEWVQRASVALPANLAVDLCVAMLLIFFPTFLMGATIPLLTVVLPRNPDEVNQTHANVYGLNTLGACFGVGLGAFWFIPYWGLPLTLAFGGMINVIVGISFFLNRLKGEIERETNVPRIKNRQPRWAIYAFAGLIGCITITVEVLLVRVLGLTVGPAYFVFPIVVGVFVFGLAIGSLSAGRYKYTMKGVCAGLIGSVVLLSVLYASAPLWPLWVNNFRVILRSLPESYPVFLSFLVVFLLVFTLPLLVLLGRILPLSYSMLDKTGANFGRECGHLYFFNTIGTVLGSVFLGHWLLNFLNIDHVLKICIVLLAGLVSLLVFKEKMGVAWRSTAIGVLCLALFMPAWNRRFHETGLFRFRTPQLFSFEFFPDLSDEQQYRPPIFFDDGPNTTVSVNEIPYPNQTPVLPGRPQLERSLLVNGKSDGHTQIDYPTMVLASVLPYLMSSKEKDLKAAIVGFGTGMTAGVLASSPDVKEVTVLEISPKVIEAAPLFDPFTHAVTKEPKAKILEVDAFKYFSRKPAAFDIVVSEPSNPWVNGTENLFTPEFYQRVSGTMSEDGIFTQWVQTYSFSENALQMVIHNLKSEFRYVQAFDSTIQDVLLLASNRPFPQKFNQRRFEQLETQEWASGLDIRQADELFALQLFNETEVDWIALSYSGPRHSLETPRLQHHASKQFFLGSSANVGLMIDPSMKRHLNRSPKRQQAIRTAATRSDYECRAYHQKFCQYLRKRMGQITAYRTEGRDKKLRLQYYDELRSAGLIQPDLDFLKEMSQEYALSQDDVGLLLQQFLSEGYWEQAMELVQNRFGDAKDTLYSNQLVSKINYFKNRHTALTKQLNQYRSLASAPQSSN